MNSTDNSHLHRRFKPTKHMGHIHNSPDRKQSRANASVGVWEPLSPHPQWDPEVGGAVWQAAVEQADRCYLLKVTNSPDFKPDLIFPNTRHIRDTERSWAAHKDGL